MRASSTNVDTYVCMYVNRLKKQSKHFWESHIYMHMQGKDCNYNHTQVRTALISYILVYHYLYLQVQTCMYVHGFV